MSRPLGLRLSQWFAAVAVLLTLTIVSGIVFLPLFSAWYLVNVAAPELQRQFGFEASYVPLAFEGEAYTSLCITSVTPRGLFDRAGVRVGDLPVGYAHRVEAGFYGDLEIAQLGRPIVLRMSRPEEMGQAWERARRLSIRLP